MLISEFARRTGLTPDTVRFYVRRGLLDPTTGSKGGANPYQVFGDEHVEAARVIRIAQGLGFSLREIAALNREYRDGMMSRERSAAILRDQLVRMEAKARQVDRLIRYMRAKIAWLDAGGEGPEPALPFDPG